MKRALGLTVLAGLLASFSAFAADYSCQGTYAHSIKFDLRVNSDKIHASLSNGGATCQLVDDDSYRPTEKYAGYRRFMKGAVQEGDCDAAMNRVIGEKNIYKGLKVSPELLDGENKGSATIVIDDGDYHGQLANEKIVCTMK